MDKKVIMLGMVFGSALGSYIPTWFGADSFSFTSLFFGAVGGIAGIWLTYRILK